MKKVGKNKVGKAIAVGAAAAAAGAAAYALLGPNGKKNRAKVKNAMINLKKKVVDNKDVKQVAGMVMKAVGNAKKDARGMMTKANSMKKKVVKKATSMARKATKKVAKKTGGKK